MNMSLYLKYRPKTISELDLAGVRKTLEDMIAGNKLSHAYLFTGPRGAGKTSAARVLARAINCDKNSGKLAEPCNECDACLSILTGSAVDVVEIDAASNRGIDDIRELKERIKLAPAYLRRKVYIIDEVHMLTTEAFNALLKTLEEPPSHAVFILCTTESHKVPETISSRCVRVTFTKATPEEMKRSFARVVMGEQAEIEDAALDVLSLAVDGSFRDGVKILDTALSLGKKVGVADVELILYGSSGYSTHPLSKSLTERDLSASLGLFHDAVREGVDLVHLLVSCMKDIRTAILAGLGAVTATSDFTAGAEAARLVVLLDETARKVATSPVPAVLVEMTIVQWCAGPDGSASQHTNGPIGKRAGETVRPKTTESIETSHPKVSVAEEMPAVSPQLGNDDAHSDQSADSQEDSVRNVSEPVGGIDAIEAWQKLIANLNGDSYSLGALLSKARPGTIRGNVITIEMQHTFHKEQLMQPKFRTRVEKLVSDAVGLPMRVECTVVKSTRVGSTQHTLQTNPQTDSIAETVPEENELLSAAEEIFSADG